MGEGRTIAVSVILQVTAGCVKSLSGQEAVFKTGLADVVRTVRLKAAYTHIHAMNIFITQFCNIY